MNRIGVVTGTRADYGIYRPLLRKINQSSELQLQLLVCGAHLSPLFGNTVEEIETDGFDIATRLETLEHEDSPSGIATSMGNGLRLFGETFSSSQPDVLIVLGDRYEMLAAVLASVPFNIPVAHIHGGEVTEGAMDDSFRHAITKMSTFHFTATEIYAARIRQMGENPENVFVTGAPGLDNIHDIQMVPLKKLERDLDLSLTPAPILVTFHPETLDYHNTEDRIATLLAALTKIDLPIIITYPNADTFGKKIIHAIETFSKLRSNVRGYKNLGTDRYFSLMGQAAVMVGNSSSGIIEAASFELPVVNIGIRQKGRVKAKNVIDVECITDDILVGIEKARSKSFRNSLRNMHNPYGDGTSADKIYRILIEKIAGFCFTPKPFFDL